MDLAEATNAPREVVIGGLAYKVSAFTRNEWGQLQAWLKDHARDPITRAYAELAEVRRKGIEIDDKDRDAVLTKARFEQSSWPPIVASPAWFDLLTSTDGGTFQFVAALFRKHQPSMTDEQVADVVNKTDDAVGEVLVWRAMGFDPPPKATGPAKGGGRRRAGRRGVRTSRKTTSESCVNTDLPTPN